MLIIAQPKSASTSIMYTLANITGLNIKPTSIEKDGAACNHFPGIQKMHSNMTIRSKNYLVEVANSRSWIFREHLLPVIEHQIILKDIQDNIVILLRNPNDSYDCYVREIENNYKKLLPKIKKDLKSFHDTYIKIAKVDTKYKIIMYDDLILNYCETMKTILIHFGLKVPKELKRLEEKNFTGVGLKRCLNQG